MRNIPYYLAAMALMVSMSLSAKATTPDELQKGEVKAVTPCVVNGEQLHCLIIQHNGENYSMAGFVKDNNFYARYIGKQVKDKWVIVWVYGQTI